MPTAAPADDIILCQPTGEKKRKKVDAAANKESDTPKKRYRYECSAEGCTNQAQKGGVCVTHGAKVKRCSVDGCTNQAQKRGVCIRHGAKVERKRCSVDGCSNQVIKRGVCKRHGANLVISSPKANGFSGYCGNQRLQPLLTQQQQQQQTLTRAANASYSLNFPHYPQQQWNNYYHNNPFLNSTWTHRCSIEGCNVAASYHGYCGMHGSQLAALPAQNNIQRGYIQERGNQNQNNAPAVEIISDDEEAVEGKLPPIAHRKREEGSGTLQKTGTYSDTGEKEQEKMSGDMNTSRKDESDKSFVGEEGILADGNGQDFGKALRKSTGEEGCGSGVSGDDNENDIRWGDDGQKEYDCWDEGGDLKSEEGKHSYVVPDEITTTIPDDQEKDAMIKRLATELKESKKMVVTLTEQLREMSSELEGAQSRSRTDREQQQAELKDLRDRLNSVSSQFEQKKEAAERLEANLRSMKVEMESQVHKSAAQLKEANEKVEALSTDLEEANKDGNEMIQRQINKFHSMHQEIYSLESKNLRLEQKVRSLEIEESNLKSALAEADIKNQRYRNWRLSQQVDSLVKVTCSKSSNKKPVTTRSRRKSKPNDSLLSLPI